MEKAIDIKRRAQRCFQSGDLDGALNEYEKLTRVEDPEPINLVLMADLLYKKENQAEASRRYLQAVEAYTKAGLYKNAIAVCKKMARLALSPAVVLQRLAELHLADGLTTEASLYYQEFAEHQAHEHSYRDAADCMRKAFEVSPENPRLLEKAAEWLAQAEDATAAVALLLEASRQFTRRGQEEDAARARSRAEELEPGAHAAHEARVVDETAAISAAAVEPAPEPEPEAPPPAEEPVAGLEQHPAFESPVTMEEPVEEEPVESPPAAQESAPPVAASPPQAAPSASPPIVARPPRPFAASPPPAAAADGTPPAPAGLRFEAAPATHAISSTPELAEIESMLRLAAERFKKGERELAGEALVEAARAYEALGRMDSAAAIFRSLGRSAHATPEVLGLWLRNCELRGDIHEAAEVSCSLGDHALNDGDLESAREWFARALRHVPNHELASRRLQRMGPRVPEAAPGGGGGTRGASTEPDGRVEVAVGRAQAVTLDLGSLIAEFQRGIESQLSGDAQSHYDLGMTYREMGLLEQAVGCFRAAAHDPAFGSRSAEMVGRCLLDEGRFEDAVEEFTRALENFAEASEAGVCLRFQLGLAHEVAGHTPEALAEFERVYAVQPNYPDVAQKIRVLRRALESV